MHTDPEDKLTREDQIAHRLDEGKNFAWIARRVTPEVASQVAGPEYQGPLFQKEFQRFYPDSQNRGAGAGVCGPG